MSFAKDLWFIEMDRKYMELLDSGLDSLCFAVVVARLEDALGVDPFSASEDTRFPVTFGEFVTLYEHAAQ